MCILNTKCINVSHDKKLVGNLKEPQILSRDVKEWGVTEKSRAPSRSRNGGWMG